MILGFNHPLKEANSQTPTWYLNTGIIFVANYLNIKSGYVKNKIIYEANRTENLAAAHQLLLEAIRRKQVSGEHQTVVFSINVGGHFATYAFNTRGEIMILNSLAGYDSDNRAKELFSQVLKNNGFKNPKVFQKVAPQGDLEKCGLVTLEMVSFIDPNRSFENQWQEVEDHLVATANTPYKTLDERHQRSWKEANTMYAEQSRTKERYSKNTNEELFNEFIELITPFTGKNPKFNIISKSSILEITFEDPKQCEKFANIIKNLISCRANAVGNTFSLNKRNILDSFVIYQDKTMFQSNFKALMESRPIMRTEVKEVKEVKTNEAKKNSPVVNEYKRLTTQEEKKEQLAKNRLARKKEQLASNREQRTQDLQSKQEQLASNREQRAQDLQSKKEQLAANRAQRAHDLQSQPEAKRKQNRDKPNL